MKELSTAQLELLKKPLDPKAVKQHPTKTYLSSIKAIYVTERLNDVFGVGQWSTKIDHVVTGDKGMVVVKLTFEVKEYGIYYECFGGNDNGGEGSKNFDLGDAYKGATTDAITKVGSYMGIAIDVYKGLADASKPQTPPPTPKGDELPWLNPGTEQWKNSVVALKGKYTIADIKKKYRLSKTNEEQLQNDALS